MDTKIVFSSSKWRIKIFAYGIIFWLIFILTLLIVWYFFLNIQIKSRIIVYTKSGPIEGSIKNYNSKLIYTFLGIPYAEPPIGRLRFRHPIPVKPWNKTVLALKQPNRCYQYSIDNKYLQLLLKNLYVQSEDCLYLNIYTPFIPSASISSLSSLSSAPSKKLLPVMIYIHGGYFLFDGIDNYDGTLLSSSGNFIVVIIAYRIGILGFISGHKDIDSNIGLYDQLEGIKWIYNNIELFGGNKDNIILVGENSGAISTGYHLLSSLSNPLFYSAIMQNGGCLTPLYVRKNNTLKLANIINITNCNNNNDYIDYGNDLSSPSITELIDDKSIECLRNKDVHELIMAQTKMMQSMKDYGFVPIFDGKFLPKNPYDLVSQAKFGPQKHILMGTNSEEGLFYINMALPFKNGLNEKTIKDKIKELFPNKGKYFDLMADLIFTDDIQDKDENEEDYNIENNDENNKKILLRKLNRFFTDVFFYCPDHEFIKSFTADNKRKIYYYKFKPKLDYPSELSEMVEKIRFNDISRYLFGKPLTNHLYNKNDKMLSMSIMKKWINFIKKGDPSDTVIWKECSKADYNYLLIKLNDTHMISGFPTDKCDSLIANFYKFMKNYTNN